MFKKRFSFVGLLITFILTSTAFIGGIAYFGKAYLGDWSALAQIARTRSLIESKYIGDVDGKKLSVGSVKGMVRELKDPYSYYLDANALAELSNEFEGHFGGIGIVMGKLEKQFVVVATVEDTPAYRAGIKSGDVILAVDNNDTVGEDLETIVKQVRGEDGTAVELKIQTGKENPRIVRVVRSDIKLPSVRGKMLDKRIGYIRIRTFNQETGKDFGKTYRELVNQGMEGLVLDLRSNPGGLLSSCVEVGQYLIPKGPIVSITEKDGRTTTERSRLKSKPLPMAILVDKGTASAAEIISGAVQDTKAGKLFGTTTYGKGCVQNIYKLTNDTAIKLTMAKYYTPSGRSIDKVGITPDVEIAPDDPTGKNQLSAAENYVREEISK